MPEMTALAREAILFYIFNNTVTVPRLPRLSDIVQREGDDYPLKLIREGSLIYSQTRISITYEQPRQLIQSKSNT
jgi:hypothetical protein